MHSEKRARCRSSKDTVLAMFESTVEQSLREALRGDCARPGMSSARCQDDWSAPEALHGIEGLLREAVEQGRAGGGIPESVDPQEIPSALLALYLGLRLLGRTRPEEALLRSIVRRAEDMLS